MTDHLQDNFTSACTELLEKTERFLLAYHSILKDKLSLSCKDLAFGKVVCNLRSNISSIQDALVQFDTVNNLENEKEKTIMFPELATEIHDQQERIWSGFYNKTYLERLDLLSLMRPHIFNKGLKPIKSDKQNDSTNPPGGNCE